MKPTSYYNIHEEFAYQDFGKKLYTLIQLNRQPRQPLILLCIGTDRVTGDSLGPLVGHQLRHNLHEFILLGDLHAPVHAMNLLHTYDLILKRYTHPFIVAVDASLGRAEHVGYITLKQGPLRPGQGIAKSLPEIGDIAITGIVNLSNQHHNSHLLQSTRLHTVMQLAEFLCLGITYAENHLLCASSFSPEL